MELNLIEYLESKNFEIEEIAKLEEKYVKDDAFGNIKKYESIYKIFSFTNITNYEINKIIINNPSLLLKSDSELIKIAYVWNGTSLLSAAALRKRGLNSDNVNRTYLRNLYLNTNIKYNDSPISYNALIMGDLEFQKDYMGYIENRPFYPSYENMIIVYGKGESLEQKTESINSFLRVQSLKWYCDKLKKVKEKNNGRGSL